MIILLKKEKKNNFKASLKAMLQPFSSSVLFLVLTGAALILPNLAVPVLSRIFIDEIWIKQAKDWFMPLLAGLAFTALLRGIITWIQQQYLIKLEFNIAVRTAAKYFKHILKLPAEFFMQRSPNELGQEASALRFFGSDDDRPACKYTVKPFDDYFLFIPAGLVRS